MAHFKRQFVCSHCSTPCKLCVVALQFLGKRGRMRLDVTSHAALGYGHGRDHSVFETSKQLPALHSVLTGVVL